MAIGEATIAGLKTSSATRDPDHPFFNDWPGFAFASCTFYECFKCKSPYFGGMDDCRRQMQEERYTLQENLRCKECLSKELGFGLAKCDKKEHGDAFIDYKCRFCCNIASFVCYNLTHFCNECHTKATRQAIQFYRDIKDIKCSGKGNVCPLGIEDHVLAWKNPRFALGCGLCRSENLHLWVNQTTAIHQKDYRKSNSAKISKSSSGIFDPRANRIN